MSVPIQNPSNAVHSKNGRNERRMNPQININRLPHEILSHIMLMGVQSDRRVWCWGSEGSMMFRQITLGVCRYWRHVAISTQALWTFIPIKAASFNARFRPDIAYARPTAPLDIAIDISPNRIDEVGVLLSRVLYFLVILGAKPCRWQTLLIRFDQGRGEVLSSLARFARQHSLSSLQWLRFDCRCTDTLEAQSYRSSHTTFGSSLSNLRQLELVSPPNEYILFSTQAFARLTTLTITCYELNALCLSKILLSNPYLESLRLGNHDRSSSQDRLDLRRVVRMNAPSLRSLFIQTKANSLWVVCMVMVIQAPGLSHFAIECSSKIQRLITYILTGVRSANSTESDSAGDPIYPLLRSLDVRQFRSGRDQFKVLSSSFPHLTHLMASTENVRWLDETPLMLPRLQYLGVPSLGADSGILNSFLSRRADLNIPIKDIEVKGGCLRLKTAQCESFNRKALCPLVAHRYEYYRGEDTTVGYLQELQWMSPRIPLW